MAAALIDAGVEAGDRVVIASATRREWVEADIAVQLAGAVTVPVYPTATAELTAHIIKHARARAVIVDTPLALEKLAGDASREALEAVSLVVCFDARAMRDLADADGKRTADLVDVAPRIRRPVVSLSDLLKQGDEVQRRRDVVGARKARVEPSSLSAVMYTSGTTGLPRGSMLTHGNVAFEVDALKKLVELGPQDEQVLFLPLAHAFARVLEMAQLRAGYVTSFAESPARVVDNVVEVGATFFGAVPRLFEKFQTTAVERAEAEGEIKRRLFSWALDVGREVASLKLAGRPAPLSLRAEHKMAERSVLAPLRAVLGPRFRFAFCGGAPLGADLGLWFFGAGITVIEGYGLTETCGATHLNRVEAPRFGTVGFALPGVEVRLSRESEIEVRGPNVMQGYLDDEEATRAVLSPDGWLSTGDIGAFDAHGALAITDRKKDIIITAQGRNVAPGNIEALFQTSALISQVVVYGDRRPHLVALVCLHQPAADRIARELGLSDAVDTALRSPEVRRKVQAEIDAVNARLSPHEAVRSFSILGREFTVEDGELTATLKIKRRAIYEKHRHLFDALYERDTRPVSPPPTAR